MSFARMVVSCLCCAVPALNAFAFPCPPMPRPMTDVGRDFGGDVAAGVTSLFGIKAAEVGVGFEAKAKGLFEKYPNVDKQITIQMMASTYCGMLNSMQDVPNGEKLDRWEKFRIGQAELQSSEKMPIRMVFANLYSTSVAAAPIPGVPGMPVVSREFARDAFELIPEETHWLSIGPDERRCPDGSSVGRACILDRALRLSAYSRTRCDVPVRAGYKVSKGCSLADPREPPAPPGSANGPVSVQCCFYQDGPQAKEMPFRHSLADWLSRK